jgi:hypothetical protein
MREAGPTSHALEHKKGTNNVLLIAFFGAYFSVHLLNKFVSNKKSLYALS